MNTAVEIIERPQYEKVLQVAKGFLGELVRICNECGELIEGNCFTINATSGEYTDLLINKQINIFSLGRVSNNILEIGFNAGHSCLLMLLANPHSRIVAFDICQHKYTIPCFNYLAEKFPGRITLIRGDSVDTIPAYFRSRPYEIFDLVHIDGSHDASVAERDFYGCYKMTRNGSFIIWDDVQVPWLRALMDRFLRQQLVVEEKMLVTFLYKHAILRVSRSPLGI